MTESAKRMVIFSMVAAGAVALMAIADLATGMPFSGTLTKTMDIVFIICAAILGYLCWECLKDAK
jgi:uncharacterized membrane protein YvlD (DUF360 family)